MAAARSEPQDLRIEDLAPWTRATIKRWMRAGQVQPRAYNNQNRIIVCMEKENK